MQRLRCTVISKVAWCDVYATAQYVSQSLPRHPLNNKTRKAGALVFQLRVLTHLLLQDSKSNPLEAATVDVRAPQAGPARLAWLCTSHRAWHLNIARRILEVDGGKWNMLNAHGLHRFTCLQDWNETNWPKLFWLPVTCVGFQPCNWQKNLLSRICPKNGLFCVNPASQNRRPLNAPSLQIFGKKERMKSAHFRENGKAAMPFNPVV